MEITVLKQNGNELTLEKMVDNTIRISIQDNDIAMCVDMTNEQVEELKRSLDICVREQ